MKSTENTKNTPSRLGFTLVELIVVITILVILATIAFTQFGSFQGSARDGDRVTTLKNIEKGLDVFQVKSGIYPLPEGEVSQGTINGSTEVYAYKGEIGDYVSRLININKTPADPLSASHYAYALSGDKKTYQVATVMENTQAYNTLFSPITSAFAAQTSYQARVNGTYPGYIKFSSGAQTWIANIPSLVWSNSGETIDLLSTGTYFVVNKYTNLPYKITPDAITENQPADILLQTITGQSNATLTGVNVTAITTQTQIADTFTGSVLASFAWVPGMEMNSPVSSHVMIMERIITGNATTGGSYIPTYLNCSETTHSGYTITPLAHATSLAFTKSITNGTGSLTATCTDGQLAYNPESVQCNATFVEWPNLTCIADVCGSTITDTNAHSTATSQTPAQSWHYDATPNICTYACNPNYTHNSGINLCEPNNCTAGVQTHNTHTYSVPQLNHSVTGSSISDPVTIPNGTQTFTTTYECSFWTATPITAEVANTPNCTTNFHYDTGTSACVSDTQTHTCTAKPATGTAWNSVSSYTQTWNGASYIPADSTTAYNVTTSTTSCRYKCDTGYVWNAGNSTCEVKLYVDDVFSAYTYTGNGATQTINNGINLSGFGGMVWLKSRSIWGTSHILANTTRGGSNFLTTETTGVEQNIANLINFTETGFSQNNNYASLNQSSATYVSWTFRKAPKFFDVVTWTSVAGANTIPHNLGIAPGMIIMKATNATDNWWVYHRSTGNNQYLVLNQTATAQTSADVWSTSPTSFTYANGVIATGTQMVAYIFAHDTSTDGIIQAGSFTSTVAAQTISLGWEPQYLLYKRTNSSDDWHIADSMRGFQVDRSAGTVNLSPNSSAAEAAYGITGPVATGFTHTNGGAGDTYIYLAIRRPNKPPTSGTQVYNAIARTGNGVATNVTGVGFAPDLLLTDVRSSAAGGGFYDRLRGVLPVLQSHVTNGEYSGDATSVTSYNMDGISFGSDTTAGVVNKSPRTYINHFFRRAPGFFDMVAYTGNGTYPRVIPHNLTVTPELMIVKSRSMAINWLIYHQSLGATYYQHFNDQPANTSITVWRNTEPTASVFTVGAITGANGAEEWLVAYLFATLPNISKVGSYTGNGTTQAINAGFSGDVQWARYILIKRTDVAGDWFVWDSVRGIVAGNDPHLSLNTAAAEVTTDDSVDPDATGFAVNQVAATNINVSGGTYIYLAIH